jgi:hypothetical protein
MNEILGNLTLTRRLRKHAIWHREPPSYGQAWVDLLLLTNDKDRDITLNGETFELKRGQLAWSQRGLEREWERSREWIQRFIRFCQDESMIKVETSARRTIITVLNYDTYQTSEQTSLLTSEPATEQTSEQARNVERVIVRGKGEPATIEIPSDEEIAGFCLGFKDLQRGIEGIPEVWWTGWFAVRVSAQFFPRDWKRALAFAHRSDWLNPLSPGHAKARFNLSARAGNTASEKKSRRERGEILQELSLAQKNGATAAEIAALKEELKNDR